jgi:hypothetical protein
MKAPRGLRFSLWSLSALAVQEKAAIVFAKFLNREES